MLLKSLINLLFLKNFIQAINVPEIRETENSRRLDRRILIFDFTRNEYLPGFEKQETTFSRCEVIYVNPSQAELNNVNVFECRPAKKNLKKIELYSMISLDRENIPEYTLQFKAYNYENKLAAESKSGLVISVIDLNDNFPIFDPKSLRGEVIDETPPGQFILQAVATDQDDPKEECGQDEANSCIVYDTNIKNCQKINYNPSLGNCEKTASSCDNVPFSIDESGKIYTADRIDAEQICSFTFLITARDSLGDPKYPHNLKNGEVFIKVVDINDNKPMFQQKIYQIDTLESVTAKDPILKVQATDLDRDKTFNTIRYLVDKNYKNEFEFRGDQLFVKKGYTLDYENTQKFKNHKKKLKIYAVNEISDLQDPNKLDFSEVEINIIDVNEPPIEKSNPIILSIKENGRPSLKNKRITSKTMQVQDLDFLGNQTVSFDIEDPEKYAAVDFDNIVESIDKFNGLRKYSLKIYIPEGKILDRECKTCDNGIYTFYVLATDNYPDNPATAKIPVQINIEDENDNPPQFQENSITICNDLSNNKVKQNLNSKRIYALERYNIPGLSKIRIIDVDDASNGPDFKIELIFNESDNDLIKHLDYSTDERGFVSFSSKIEKLPVGNFKIKFKLADHKGLENDEFLNINVCDCKDITKCKRALILPAGENTGYDLMTVIIIIVIALILILLIGLFVIQRNRQHRKHPNQPNDIENMSEIKFVNNHNEDSLLIKEGEQLLGHSPNVSSSNYTNSNPINPYPTISKIPPPSTEFIARLRDQTLNGNLENGNYGNFIENLKANVDREIFNNHGYGAANDELYKTQPIEGDGNAGLDLSSFIDSDDNDGDVKISPDRGWGSKFDALADICNEQEEE